MLVKFNILFNYFFFGNVIFGVVSDKMKKNCFSLLNSTPFKYEFTIENDGFHKIFNVHIQLATDNPTYLKTNCNLMIVQDFGSNFYVDEFELKQSIYMRLFSFFLSDKVNTESIEYRSEPFMLFMIINKNLFSCDEISKKCNVSFSYPFHLRYHAPSINKLHKNLKLIYPRVLVANCHDHDRINQNEFILKNIKKNDKKIINDLFIGNCFWDEIGNTYSKNQIELSVPVGQAEYGNMVIIITLVFLILLSLFLSKLFREKSLELDKKAN